MSKLIQIRAASMLDALLCSLPLIVLTTAAALSWLALPGLTEGREARIVATALTLDLTVVVPALVYLLFVRTKRAPWIVIVPAFVIGHLVATATLPSQHDGALEILRYLVAPLELCVVVYLVVLARRTLVGTASGTGDFATRFRSAACETLGSRLAADILTTEISLLYHAFGRHGSTERSSSYTVHREVAYLPVLIGLMMALVAETIPVHLLVSRWSDVAAWILTALSVYGCLWLVGDYRAMTARPLRITPTHLALRVGMRWEADIPVAKIVSVEQVSSQAESPAKDVLVAALLRRPNLRLMLAAPTEVIGMYGLRRVVTEIWLTVDRAGELRAELEDALRGA